MDNRKLHANMNLSCEVVSIGEIECSYRAMLSLDEHSVALLEIMDTEVDFYHKIQGLKEFLICAKTLNDYFTLIGSSIIESQFSIYEITDNNVRGKGKICFWISDILVGSEYAIEISNELLFNGFSCQFTDVFELFGLYPYRINDTSELPWSFQSVTMENNTKTMEFYGGYSCFVAPYVYKKNNDYIFSMDGRLNYSAAELKNITEQKEKIRLLELFFEILSGETVTALDVKMYKGDNIFEYTGLCNYPKKKLKGLSNGLDSKGYLRKSVFKLSDWKDMEKNVIERFSELAKDNLLAMESYKQVLLDEEIKIVTYNKFLKIMQMIEGIMRTKISDEEKKNFEKRKKKVKKHLENQEDKDFIDNYCFNNGDNFRTCLIELTKESVTILSGVVCVENFNSQIDKIINDRNAYTHASKKIAPIMNEEQIEAVNCCYKTFYRIKILKQLNLSDEIICNRFLFDRKFVAAYKICFGLAITNVDENHNTGEFDNEMYAYI